MPGSANNVEKSRVSLVLTGSLAVAALYFAREVLIPLALAVLLSFLLAPLVTRLEAWKFRRVPSVLVVVAVVFGVVFAIGWVMADQVVQLAENVPTYQDEIVRKVRSLRGQTSGIGASIERLGDELEKAAAEPTSRSSSAPVDATTEVSGDPARQRPAEYRSQGDDSITGRAPGRIPTTPGTTPANPLFTVPVSTPGTPLTILGAYLGLALAPLGTAALVMLFVIFMLLEREDLRNRMIRLMSREKYTVTTNALDDAGTRISRYMVALSIVNGTYGLAVGAGLWLIGLTLGNGTPFPSFVLWGILCALLRFVPYVGPWVAAAFPLALALAVYPGFTVFAVTAALIVVIELVSNNVMEPWLYGVRTGMSALAILVAAAFWTWLWGPIGLLLATPLTVCIAVLGKHVPSLAFLHVLLGDQPALPPGVSFYQRLLAGDRNEALKLAREYAATLGTEHVPDDLMIPALRLTRRDRHDEDLSANAEADILSAMKSVIDQLDGQGQAHEAPSIDEQIESSERKWVVLGCAAHNEAEEIVLHMLSRLMKLPGVEVQAISTRTLPVEIESRIANANPAIVFISLLPPGGLVQARYLCRRLRRRFKDLPIIVGYWGRSREFDRLLARILAAGASSVTTSLLQSLRQIQEILGLSTSPETLLDIERTAAVAGGGIPQPLLSSTSKPAEGR